MQSATCSKFKRVKPALSKQADADTKLFAEKMVQDHQKTSSELKGVVEGSMVKLTLPTSLDAEHQKMLNELNAKSGEDFDQTYDQIQVKTHREAVALFEAYSKSGEGFRAENLGRQDAAPSQGAFEHGEKTQVAESRGGDFCFCAQRVASLRCNTDEQGVDRYVGLDL